MPGFYYWQDVFDYIKLQLREALTEVVKELQGHVAKELWDNWYQYSSPDTVYERTYQLLNSITFRQSKNQKKYIEFEIFYNIPDSGEGFDAAKPTIIPDEGTDDKPWWRHKSMRPGYGGDTGSEFITGLTEVMEHGNPSPLYGWTEGEAPKPFARTMVWEESKQFVIKYIMKELRERGFAVTDRIDVFKGK